MNRTNIALVALMMTAMALVATDALAAGNAEDQIMGIMERVLDLIAKFLDQIFQSIADAVRSVWSPSKDS